MLPAALALSAAREEVSETEITQEVGKSPQKQEGSQDARQTRNKKRSPQGLCTRSCDTHHPPPPACAPADWATGGFQNQSSSSVHRPTTQEVAGVPERRGPQPAVTPPSPSHSLSSPFNCLFGIWQEVSHCGPLLKTFLPPPQSEPFENRLHKSCPFTP